MATLTEYYEADFSRVLNVANDIHIRGNDFEAAVRPRLHMDHDANAMWVSCLVPSRDDAGRVCWAILKGIDKVLEGKDGFQVLSGHAGASQDEMLDSTTLRFTGRVYFYCEGQIPREQRLEIARAAADLGLFPVFRGQAYVQQRVSWQKPVAFICHDSRDKEAVAKPIALGLIRRLCPVWYDEYSLSVGDRLRESVEKGLKECQRCILVLSPRFLSNTGWTKTEFDSVFTREVLEASDVILPVWHDVGAKEVYEYSSSLANRVAVNWSFGEEEVVRRLHAAMVKAGAV